MVLTMTVMAMVMALMMKMVMAMVMTNIRTFSSRGISLKASGKTQNSAPSMLGAYK